MQNTSPSPATVEACACGSTADLVPVIDPDGSALSCRLCLLGFIGRTSAPIAVLVDVAPVAVPR